MESYNSIECAKKHDEFQRAELDALSKEELIEKILVLQKQNENKLKKSSHEQKLSTKKDGRKFNFDAYRKHHILLKFSYLGWDRHGFATQDNTQNTIEAVLFEALIKTKLIESRESSNYHRCGRTDKGVSAFSQVISLTVRSNFKKDGDNTPASASDDIDKELNYPQILNRVLPNDIQVLAWSPVPSEFSARFNCCSRTYKYFFPKGTLDLEAMTSAAQYLIGEHDFRNLCKMDVGNGVVTYNRKILDINLKCITPSNYDKNKSLLSKEKVLAVSERGYDMCVITIRGQAFLWHQIRAIMTVLLLVGLKKEEPDIFLKLLDIQTNPRKPQYGLASEIPLNLYSSEYKGIQWRYDAETLSASIKQLQQIWTLHAVKSSMVHSMLSKLEEDLLLLLHPSEAAEIALPVAHVESLIHEPKSRVYKPLLQRQTCDSLEDRIKHYVKKRRLDPQLMGIQLEDELINDK